MRRAVAVLLLIAALPLSALAAKPEGPVDAMTMIDFRRGPHFKVGDWVKYHTHGNSEQGFKTDYTVTVLIAGEELWWGEECFWVESQTSYSGRSPELAASLLSYAVFQDSLPARHFQRYIRKYIDGFDEQGVPVQQLFQRAPSELIIRGYGEYEPYRQRDTLGVEQVEVPKGTFDALREIQRFREYTTQQDGDSTVYFERTEDYTHWWSDTIPITSLVRVDQEDTQRRRVWMIGESQDAPLRIAERAIGSTELVDFGTGMKPRLVPERFQRPLSEQRAPRPKRPPPPAARKATGTRG
ncbi:MAG: hypothetical protein AAB290_06805 [Candidatus Eisenbacteria bacterium]